MTLQEVGQVRIAIGGRCLDEVCIRQARVHAPNTVSYLSFPAHRHEVWVEQDHLVVSTQAATVVQLFTEGALAPVGGAAVTVQIGDQAPGSYVLEAVEIDGADSLDRTIILRFGRRGTTS